MNVGHICDRGTVTLKPEDGVGAAARLMRDGHVGMLVVVGAAMQVGHVVPVGVVTDRDIMVAVVADEVDAGSLKVGDVMTNNPATAMVEDLLPETLEQMRRLRVRRLPVVGASGHFVGVISVDDILAELAGELSSAVGALTHEHLPVSGSLP